MATRRMLQPTVPKEEPPVEPARQEPAPVQAADRPRPGREVPYRPDVGVLIESIFEQRPDVVGEFRRLEAALQIDEALAPEYLRRQLADVDTNALAAHRLAALARADLEAYRIENEVALGAMRDHATHVLSAEKKSGERTKQITDADVREKAASLYPDEWRDLNHKLVLMEQYAKHVEVLADRWMKRSFVLNAMLGGRS